MPLMRYGNVALYTKCNRLDSMQKPVALSQAASRIESLGLELMTNWLIKVGVLQGSVLFLVLYNMFVKEMLGLPEVGRLKMYEDDILLTVVK